MYVTASVSATAHVQSRTFMSTEHAVLNGRVNATSQFPVYLSVVFSDVMLNLARLQHVQCIA
jgi:hypothetical protein